MLLSPQSCLIVQAYAEKALLLLETLDKELFGDLLTERQMKLEEFRNQEA